MTRAGVDHAGESRRARFYLRFTAGAFALALLAGCGPSTKLPPLPPQADFCTFYQSYRYSKAAATVEEIDALRKHNANEMAFAEKCLLGPRPNSLGPR